MAKPLKSPVEPAHSLFGREHYPLDVFFKPRSVAVIGASEAERSVGRATLWNLISSPFGGTVYPVNPKRPSVLGMRAYPTVKDVPEPVELAIVVTPAPIVPGIIRECVEAGVQGAIILSAGFREIGEQGAALEQQVLAEARRGSLRIIGPNCLGVMCPGTGLNATFANGMARQGSVAFISQSGALCTAVLDWSHRELVGFSAFISLGSMADIGWGDVIDYLGNDPRTRSILLYMESIGDAGSFVSAAREVALSKPIIVIKAGRTAEGARAAAAHTGANTGSDAIVDAALRRAGVLRVHQISDLFYMAEVLSKQPRPRGKRLAIVTNAGGPAVLAADALILGGGELAPASPIDLLGDAKPQDYATALDAAAKDPNNDGLLVILAPQASTDSTQTAEQLKPYAKLSKPVLASWMGGVDVAPGVGVLRAAGIPTFPYPDTATRMFLYMHAYNENLRAIYETPLRESADCPTTDDLKLPANARIAAGSHIDEQLGPVLYVESARGERIYGLPPLNTTLAGLMLRQIHEENEANEHLLVRLSRFIVEQPSVREVRITTSGVVVEHHPPDATLPKPAIRPYPLEYVSPWTMKNGEEVIIRPIRSEDEPLVAHFHQTLGERTVYFRYLSALKLSTRIAHERLIRICFIDYARQMALVVERNGEIVAIGRLVRDLQAYARGKREAEFALVVSDSLQGQGLGKELLRRLIDIGKRESVELIYGEISAENMTMQAICRSMGFVIKRDMEDTTVVARLKL